MHTVKTKKVFISYSWSSEAHKNAVLDLAIALRQDGVDVILDVWDLNVGQDKFVFMEQMVSDPTVDRVLIVSDRLYAEKADMRQGGVGTETQIITAEIYQDAGKNRFIPIIFERNKDNGEPFLPIYAKNRMYIDLSEDSSYQEGYTSLIREIYERPDLRKPELGKTPSFILEDTVDSFLIERKSKDIERASNYNPERLPYLVKDFFDTFTEELEKLAVDKNVGENEDEAAVRVINDSIEFRKSMLKVLNTISMSNEYTDMLIDFFEEFNNRIKEIEHLKSNTLSSEAIKFLLNEIFILTITTLIRFGNWKSVSKLCNNLYYDENNSKEVDYVNFRKPLRVIYEGELERKSKRVSLSADLIKERASSLKEFKDMVGADLFLYYVSIINPDIKNDWFGNWFPILHIYIGSTTKNIKVLSLLKSKDSLEKILPVFNVGLDELKEKIDQIGRKRGYSNSFEMIPAMNEFIESNEIGSRP
ncbi:SEFIR domain-containing protein [Enterococcus sp. AZ012]|uniref:SEFIR domain-containing protein n=1 Tax=unclassified Enterococcus TaxID=2608891 RepID=UPI003D26E638